MLKFADGSGFFRLPAVIIYVYVYCVICLNKYVLVNAAEVIGGGNQEQDMNDE